MFTLPKLDYGYDALEPVIDTETMELHHTKHHQTYVDKLNSGLEAYPKYKEKNLEELFAAVAEDPGLPADLKGTILKFAGGHYNHSFFWKHLGPVENGGHEPGAELLSEIERVWGSYEKFQAKFEEKAGMVFGSGWCWLVRDKEDRLVIEETLMQEPPLLKYGMPIIGIDLWEHAFYLKYRNRRAEYVKGFWKIVVW